jgi:hypothetical protein
LGSLFEAIPQPLQGELASAGITESTLGFGQDYDQTWLATQSIEGPHAFAPRWKMY